MTDHRKEALDHADTSEDYGAIGLTHALIYVGDGLADAVMELSNVLDTLKGIADNGLRTNTRLEAIDRSVRAVTSATPELAATLAAPTPFAEGEPGPEPEVNEESEQPSEVETDSQSKGYFLPGGRPYRPASNPADWRLDATTQEMVSPAGRRFKLDAMQAQGVLRKLKKRNLPIRQFDPKEPRPIRTEPDQSS